MCVCVCVLLVTVPSFVLTNLTSLLSFFAVKTFLPVFLLLLSPLPKFHDTHLSHFSSQPETLQIANYYDLYNSLIVWSTKKWGCSGEHVTGLYHENEQGKLFPLKADHDVLGVNENGVIVVEIKD